MGKTTIFVLLAAAAGAAAVAAYFLLSQRSANDGFGDIASGLLDFDAPRKPEFVPTTDVVAGGWSRTGGTFGGLLVGFDTPAVVVDSRASGARAATAPVFGFSCYPEEGDQPRKGLVLRLEGLLLRGIVPEDSKALPVFVTVARQGPMLKQFVVTDIRGSLVLGGEDARALFAQLGNAKHVSIAVPGQTVQFSMDGLKTVSEELLSKCPAGRAPTAAPMEVIIIPETAPTFSPP